MYGNRDVWAMTTGLFHVKESLTKKTKQKLPAVKTTLDWLVKPSKQMENAQFWISASPKFKRWTDFNTAWCHGDEFNRFQDIQRGVP